jgi:predicted RNase H-like HicB family nuclease
MQTQILNYRIIIEPEKMGRKTVYNAYCPTLGVADWGNSVEEAIKHIQSLIKFHIECLLEDKVEVPMDNLDKEIVASTRISIAGSDEKPQVMLG